MTVANVSPGSVSLENDGHVYTFDGATGKWSDVDLRAIIDAPMTKNPMMPGQPSLEAASTNTNMFLSCRVGTAHQS